MTIDDLPEVLTIDETARFLRISRGLAFTAAGRGEIPAVRVGRRLLVPRTRLLAWLQADRGDDATQRVCR